VTSGFGENKRKKISTEIHSLSVEKAVNIAPE
jgi:hypothetical protein